MPPPKGVQCPITRLCPARKRNARSSRILCYNRRDDVMPSAYPYNHIFDHQRRVIQNPAFHPIPFRQFAHIQLLDYRMHKKAKMVRA
jgi:hypothetical protein